MAARIRAQLDQPERRVSMQPLQRHDVMEIVQAATDLDPLPDRADCERLYDAKRRTSIGGDADFMHLLANW